ncbi:tetraspanin-18-like [Mercenaria mercenaria]|uniref:tetraspanin-18-like n=1 Tax=Mercenaria mercenaria TaxID=6596 RepID=UPI00234F942B|nr:tetraspanin-18-like [Mercenaria mercenaria]
MEGQKCTKYFLVLLNVVVFLAGGACFAAGLMFKLDSGFLESDVVSLFNNIQYSNIPLGFVCDLLAYLMMCFGGLIVFVAILGMCGAWKGTKSCLWVFIVLVVFFLLVEGVLIGLWMSVRGRTDQWLRGQMLDQLKGYAGPDQTDKLSKGWNTLFMEARCCGVNDQFKDGGTNSDFTELPTTWTSGTDKVPATCCQGVQSDTVTNYVNSAFCTNTPTNFYTEGCYDRVVSYINTYSLISIVACGVCILAEVMGIVGACVLIDKAKTAKVEDSHAGRSRPPPYVAIDHDRRVKPKPKDQGTIGRTPRY